MFKKVLIANRGEIAVRVARTCRALGIATVAVYSEADRRALHVLEADEAVPIGPAPVTESYLNIPAIVEAALRTGAEAVHPGYGLLSENAAFAEACREAGLVFVGPPPEAIRLMGDKSAARRLAASHGVPIVPGYDGDSQEPEALLAQARRLGFPVMVKAAAGGGGRGMRLIDRDEDFLEAVESARREAQRAFGDGRLLLEKAVVGARHVEVQVLADTHGNYLHLGERDCSLQRRHQKVVEEAPSPAVDEALRQRLGEAALAVARAAGYVNAGTVEFLLDSEGSFYFLEMNTRLQVEHGVTELVTVLDLVALQLLVAGGEPLPLRQEDVRLRGHAFQCRIYAEDPFSGYLPSAGTVAVFQPPQGEGIRNDVGTYAGDEVTAYYDPLVAKLLTWGADRREALARMRRALDQYRIEGIRTNLPLLRAVMAHPVMEAGQVTTDFLETRFTPEALVAAPVREALLSAFGAAVSGALGHGDPWLALGPWRPGGLVAFIVEHEGRPWTVSGRRQPGSTRRWQLTVEGQEVEAVFAPGPDGRVLVESGGRSWPARVQLLPDGLLVEQAGRSFHLRWHRPEPTEARAVAGRAEGHVLVAPLSGIVVKVAVEEGQRVRARQTLLVLEAMKMEHSVDAPADAVVQKLHCRPGDRVREGQVLVELEPEGARG
ncbi:Acetyl-/propionyl-coenzyme A carboxylase alpha chain [bacterium HR24]|nr:Acetyl-/propionyl-coenzyme A carboxylase alpha chain [bacterium HR24]